VLKILLIEDDPVDAAWITELIKEKRPTIEVVHSTSLPDASSILAQRPIDTVFISVRPDGDAASIQDCREMVRRAGRRSVVALVNAAEMAHAAEIRGSGVKFVYRKHPIMRTAQIRKQELREKLGFGLKDDRTTQPKVS
jgi:DNA-binding NarL/FixJ family response regulator